MDDIHRKDHRMQPSVRRQPKNICLQRGLLIVNDQEYSSLVFYLIFREDLQKRINRCVASIRMRLLGAVWIFHQWTVANISTDKMNNLKVVVRFIVKGNRLRWECTNRKLMWLIRWTKNVWKSHCSIWMKKSKGEAPWRSLPGACNLSQQCQINKSA